MGDQTNNILEHGNGLAHWKLITDGEADEEDVLRFADHIDGLHTMVGNAAKLLDRVRKRAGTTGNDSYKAHRRDGCLCHHCKIDRFIMLAAELRIVSLVDKDPDDV